MITNREIDNFLKKKGARLRRLRKHLGISQQQMEKKTGIDQTIASFIENGKGYTMSTYYKYLRGLRK